ncbi:hypothetical protein GJ496_006774 [Pomphorhynchus laevis]|nr:hypothetical protein GJ496_006774 [Pomphorhynchus laevis]
MLTELLFEARFLPRSLRDSQNESASLCAFADTNICVNTDGISILGAPIGDKEYVKRYVLTCTDEWREIIEKLSTMAELDAHSTKFDIGHALSCRMDGILIARHNDLRDLLADAMTEVCNGVAIEPQLQHVSDNNIQEQYNGQSA